MNIMELIISKSVIDCDILYCKTYYFVCTSLCYSCWIKSDDGAIAAFIVPIVAIILVQLKLQLNHNKLILLQINCIFLVITLKVLWQQKTRYNQDASNKDTIKYGTVFNSQLFHRSAFIIVTDVY